MSPCGSSLFRSRSASSCRSWSRWGPSPGRHASPSMKRSATTSAAARSAGAVAALPDVVHAEYWPDTLAFLVEADGAVIASVHLMGPDGETKLFDLPILEGRWLDPDEARAVVVNQALRAYVPGLRVGTTL